MMKRIRLVFLVAFLLLLAVPAGTALAAPQDDFGRAFDRIITGGDFSLEAGEIESGDVVIFGGSAEIEDGAVIEGDLAVFGGSAEIDGNIEGSVVVFGGNVDVSDTAYIGGDFAVIGGSAKLDPDAQIEGDVATNPDWSDFPFGRGEDGRSEGPAMPELPAIPEVPRVPDVPTPPRVVYVNRPDFSSRVGSAFLSAIGMAVIAFLIGLFLPKHVEQVRQVMVREPLMSGTVGFLTFVAAALLTPVLAVISGVLVLICIGILGFPIIVLMWLLIGAATIFGWAAFGQLAGQWLSQRFNLQGLNPVGKVALGAFSLALGVGMVEAVPVFGIIGGFIHFGIFCFSLGAVVLTRFGRRDYHRGQPILPQRKPKPAAPAEVDIEEPAPAEEKPVKKAEPKAKAPAKKQAEEKQDESRFDTPPLEDEGPFPEK